MRRRLCKWERVQVYQKMGGHCAYCGCDLKYKDMQVDHVIALRRGGADTLDNMLPACRSCNYYKDTLTIEGFRDNIARLPTVLMRDNVTYKIAVRFGTVHPNPHKVKFYFEKVTDSATK
jgi:hypothetical protein